MMGLTGVRPDATSRTAVILLGHGNLPPTEGKGEGVSRRQLHGGGGGLKGEGEKTLVRMGARVQSEGF